MHALYHLQKGVYFEIYPQEMKYNLKALGVLCRELHAIYLGEIKLRR